jgi:hypothetical protein
VIHARRTNAPVKHYHSVTCTPNRKNAVVQTLEDRAAELITAQDTSTALQLQLDAAVAEYVVPQLVEHHQ